MGTVSFDKATGRGATSDPEGEIVLIAGTLGGVAACMGIYPTAPSPCTLTLPALGVALRLKPVSRRPGRWRLEGEAGVKIPPFAADHPYDFELN